MPLTSVLRHYDPRWPEMYVRERARLAPVLPTATEFHHIGSTAVEGLAAKAEIDILALVDREDTPDHWTATIADLGYRRGGDLSPGHRFFKRDVGGVRTHKLHLCVTDHPMALQMLYFRDHLRRHPADRARYAELKFRLEAENSLGIREYLDAKAPFIQSILDQKC